MRYQFPFWRFEGLLHKLYAPLVFRRSLARFGVGAFVSPFAMLERMHLITIGDHSHVSRRCTLLVAPDPSGVRSSSLTIGRHSYIGRGCTLSACGTLTIGDEVTFGDNVYCSAGQHGFSEPGRRVLEQPMQTGTVTIGNGAWIGYGVFISTTRDLTIGENAIVAANSVVTRDIPAGVMVGGIPAKPLRRWNPSSGTWQGIEEA